MNRIVVGVDIAKRVFVRPASRMSFCFTGFWARKFRSETPRIMGCCDHNPRI
jgi:hypothetical protein